MSGLTLVADRPGYASVPLKAGETVSIGRKNCGINVSHKKVSSKHFTVCLESARPLRVIVRDQSINGVFINGVRVAATSSDEKQADIWPNDMVSFNFPSREKVSAMMGDEVE